MLQEIKASKLQSLCNQAVLIAVLVSILQGTFFSWNFQWEIFHFAAIFLAAANLFVAVSFLIKKDTHSLWKVLVFYFAQLAFFLIELLSREPSVSPRLLEVALILLHALIVVSALIGVRRILLKPYLMRIPIFIFATIFLLEVGLRYLPANPAVRKQGKSPQWSAAPDVNPAIGHVYHPHTELRSYYPDNPRGYFHEETTGALKLSLRNEPGNEVDLVSNAEVTRIEIKKSLQKNPYDIQLNAFNLSVKNKTQYRLDFRARADQPREVYVGVAKAHEPWDGLGLYKKIQLQQQWQSFQETFEATADDPKARILFDIAESEIPLEISSVRLLTIREIQASPDKDSGAKSFVNYRFNDLGCRGRDYSIPKPASVKRVLILGNAYALGVGVHEEDTVASKLEKLLNQNSDGNSYEVVNCGGNGYQTREERLFYEIYGTKYEPDIVLLLMTAQDQPADMRIYPLKRHLFLTWERLFHSEDQLPFPSFNRSILEILQMDDEVRKKNGQSIVVFFRINGDQKGATYDGKTWNDLIATVTTGLPQNQIQTLDLTSALHKDHSDAELLVHPRIGPHPNEIAHGIASQEIFNYLRTKKLIGL